MKLRELGTTGWRNLGPAVFRPGPRLTVLHGHNAQGKTNLLEAVYYAVEFRSFRTRRAGDLVQWGQACARVSAQVEIGGLETGIEIEVSAEHKAVAVDGKAARRTSPRLRGLAAVVFVPEDLLLPRAAPAARRSFIDRVAYGLDRTFWEEAVAYQKILKSRNAVLRKGRGGPALLETFDEELARSGARLVMRRRHVIASLNPRVAALFAAIHRDLPVDIRYQCHDSITAARTEDHVRLALLAGLVAARAVDQLRRSTGFGPHTDDPELWLAGRPAREHGSQGQLRSLVLALKLAELAELSSALGEAPLLLLDDVASELDDIRRAKLFETIAGFEGQTIITVTDPAVVPAAPERVDFEIAGGNMLYTPPKEC